jgi:hypothetical protein
MQLDDLKNDIYSESDERKSEDGEEVAGNDAEEAEQDGGWTPLPNVARFLPFWLEGRFLWLGVQHVRGAEWRTPNAHYCAKSKNMPDWRSVRSGDYIRNLILDPDWTSD